MVYWFEKTKLKSGFWSVAHYETESKPILLSRATAEAEGKKLFLKMIERVIRNRRS